MNQNKLYQNFLELCAVPSVSESGGELEMVQKLHDMLNRFPYFKKNPAQVRVCPIPRDSYGRSYVSAFMEGGKKSHRTILLLSHFDVVGADDYGLAKGMAFDPAAYTQYCKEHPEAELPEEARRDLESGDYLFGRGTMDMKFGIAADLAVLEEAGKVLGSFEGNLLFLSVPDEEANSAGMRAAAEHLLTMKQEKDLEYVCCFVSEPHFPKFPGDSSKYIYTGTVGKLLPVFCCFGKPTHAGEPFSGLNPNLLTAKLIEMIESNPEYADSAAGTFTPPPVCLKQSDEKTEYSVQSPEMAYAYFNDMTLAKTPDQVMAKMLQTAQEALSAVFADMREKADAYARLTGSPCAARVQQGTVLSFHELYEWCKKTHGSAFEDHMKHFIHHADEGTAQDLRRLSVEAAKEARKFCPFIGPMIVVLFAPPYYPHSEAATRDSAVSLLCRSLQNRAKEHYGETLLAEPFFPGLSDMSYLSLPKGICPAELEKNFPVWGDRYSIPTQAMAQLNIPFLCFGPSGKDAHKNTERLCLSYSFETAAPLLWDAVCLALGME